MIAIEKHLEVYVDPQGHVCLAQPSMDDVCNVALDPGEINTLIEWLAQARDEALAMRGPEETLPTAPASAPSLSDPLRATRPVA